MLPTGTVTFLFTDIEGSTYLLRQVGEAYAGLLERHAALVRDAVGAAGGLEVSTEGDSFFVVFSDAGQAVAAAVGAQRALAAASWPAGVELRVRMGLHTGSGILGGDNYVGLDVHRAARIAAASYGGQVVVSAATAGIVSEQLPEGVTLRDLGGHRLKDLEVEEQIYQLLIAGLPADFPPLRSLGSYRSNLPVPVTGFVGRQSHLAAVAALLGRNRLVTLVGPGGTGKTRIALEVAGRVANRFRDGVCFVSLAPITDASLVASAILAGLEVRDSGRAAPRDLLADYLAERRLLLVLDNLEQIQGMPPLIADLLQSAPGCAFLATSRSALQIRGEQEYAVPPLEVPDPDSWSAVETMIENEAVALFVDRARAVRSDFELTREKVDAIGRLVTRLDGLPLAIELAASRIKLLPPAALLSRLSNRLLAGGARDLPARQQTLNATIAWSYDLLDPGHQRLMDRMSVFVGGVTLAEAEVVCSDMTGMDVLDGLGVLVSNSLLDYDDADGEPRFSMLQVLREYARERLEAGGRSSAVRIRHLNAYLALAEEAETHLLTSQSRSWLDRLEVDVDNLRAAISFAVETGDTESAMRLVSALWRFLHMRGHLFEATTIIEQVLALPGGNPALRSEALLAQGGIAYWRGDVESCLRINMESVAICRDLGDKQRLAQALYSLSFPCSLAGEYERGDQALEEARILFEELEDHTGLADVHWGMGDAAFNRGDHARARDFFEIAIADYQRLDHAFGLGWAHYMFGKSLSFLGDMAAARRNFEKGLGLFARAGDVSAFTLHLADLAGVAFHDGDRERAATLLGTVAHMVEITGGELVHLTVNMVYGLDIEGIRLLRSERSSEFDRGRFMSFEEAVGYALEGADLEA